MCEGIERSLSVICSHAAVSHASERHIRRDYVHESIVDTASAEWYPVNDVAVFRSEVIESERSLLRKDVIDRLVYVVENNNRQNGSEDFFLHKAVVEAV